MKRLRKVNLIKTVFIVISLGIVLALKWLFLLINLGTSYCTGTGTGLNYVYLVCNQQIWLPVTTLVDLVIAFTGLGIILFSSLNKWFKIIILVGIIILIPLLGLFYNPDVFSFWWINVWGVNPVA